ncbi:MAG: hypothetical protein PHH83_02290, partial [Patescibacteria group bacterium]|nr:hypothetical protein [Patescibacteria group bacterium]
MSDINLLPDDFKKREQKILQKKDNFSNSGIEFTNGKPPLKINNNSKNSLTNSTPDQNLNRNKKINSNGLNNNPGFDNGDFENENVFDLDNLDIISNKVKKQEIKHEDFNTIQKPKIENKSLLKDKKREKSQSILDADKSEKKSKQNILKYLENLFNNLFNKKSPEEDGSDVNLLPKELNIVSGRNAI